MFFQTRMPLCLRRAVVAPRCGYTTLRFPATTGQTLRIRQTGPVQDKDAFGKVVESKSFYRKGNTCGAVDVVQSMWCKLCGAIYVVQLTSLLRA